MLTLLERNIKAIEQRLVLLAPAAQPAPDEFRHVSVDSRRYRKLLHGLQRLRGQIYLQDGAIQPSELSRNGRHRMPQDGHSWHLVMLNATGQVSGCIWYREHGSDVSMNDLRVRTCPLITDEDWHPRLTRAIEAEMARATAESVRYAEVGGWAVSAQAQCPAEGFLLALGAYSLSRLLGHGIGLTTATYRHSSAAILCRLGLSRFVVDGEPLPVYYDPKYRCEMELLHFDSRVSSPRYECAIELLKQRLRQTVVVSATAPEMAPTLVHQPAFAEAGAAA